jgi:surface antigen
LTFACGLLASCAANGPFGETLTSGDQRIMERTAQQALERNQVGQSSNWHNPDTGHLGTVTLLRNLGAGADQCRDYQMTVTLSPDRTEVARYTACRQADGGWVNRGTARLAGSDFSGRPYAYEPGAAGTAAATLSTQDQRVMERAAQAALERNRVGEAEAWRNPETGFEGTITPLRTYRTAANEPCRDYEMAVSLRGTTNTARYTACRRTDGVWVNREDNTIAGSRFDAGPPYAEPPYYGSPPGYPRRPVWP